jgi:hypothetical protein
MGRAVNNMSMIINGDSFTTFDDIWEASNLTQPEKDEIQSKIDLVRKTIEANEQISRISRTN